jgi:hypothetical protein
VAHKWTLFVAVVTGAMLFAPSGRLNVRNADLVEPARRAVLIALNPTAVLHIRRRDHDQEHQTERIDQQMTLASGSLPYPSHTHKSPLFARMLAAIESVAG